MILTELKGIDRFQATRSILGVYPNIYLGVTFEKFPSSSQWRKAILHAFRTHYRLGCNVKVQDSKVYLNLITNEQSVYWDDIVLEKDWSEFGEEESNFIFQKLDFKYNTDTILWRLIMVPKMNMCVLVTSHALCDGISLCNIWNTLCEALDINNTDELMEVNNNNVIFEKSNYPELKGKDLSHPFHKINSPISWSIKKLFAPKVFPLMPNTFLSPDRDLVQFKDFDIKRDILSDTSNENQYCLKDNNKTWKFHIEKNNLERILMECKTHKVSLTSYIAAAIIISFNKVNKNKFSGSKVKISIPMNARKFCIDNLKIDNKSLQIGNFICGMNFSNSIQNEQDIWVIAISCQKDIFKYTKTNAIEKLHEVKMLDVVDSNLIVKTKSNLRYPSETFGISNLGLETIESQKFEINDIEFGVPPGFWHYSSFSLISTPSIGLKGYMCYPRTLYKEFEPFIKCMKELLQISGDNTR